MQLTELARSRFALQRLVAFVTCAGALTIALVNFIALRRLYELSPLHASLHPSVLWIGCFSLAFLVTAHFDSITARSSQVGVFALGGIVAAIQSTTGNLTSAVFVVFAMVLFNEYVSQRTAAIVAGGVGVVYVLTLAMGIDTRTASVVLSLLNTMVLVSVMIVLFALISYRQHLMRKEHESILEQLVAERTLELREALEQRDTMLQEIHHRVGNSLQLLVSFISLQQEEVDDAQRQVLKETELRVHAIADVHATLYSQHKLSHLPLRDYVADLIANMQVAYRGEAEISASVETLIEAHLDFAISFGIILNELITNAAKHGATGGERARINASITEDRSDLYVVVRDHGSGFPLALRQGIGSEVVEELVRQNDGQLTRKTDDGAIVTIVFPKSSVVREAPVEIVHAYSAPQTVQVTQAPQT